MAAGVLWVVAHMFSKKGDMMKNKLISFLLLLCSVGANALTMSQIETQVRRNMRDTATDTTLQRYSSSLLIDMANEAQRDIVNQTWAIESITTITPSVGTIFYSLPTDYLATIKVSYRKGTTAPYELTEVSRKGLFASNPAWETTTGSPTQYYIRQSTTTDFQELAFVPPINSGGAGTATIEYFASAADMAAGTDTPFGASQWFIPYHDAIVYRITARLKMIEGKNDEATNYMTLYGNYVSVMKARIGERPNFNPSISVGTPR